MSGIEKMTAEPMRLEGSTLHLLHRADQCAFNVFYDGVDRGTLTLRQYIVLATIRQNSGIDQSTLVRSTGIDRSTLSDVVRRLARKGHIVRRRKEEDARAYAIRLTPSGEAALDQVEPIVQSAEARILSILPEERVEAFKEDLKRISSLNDELIMAPSFLKGR